MAPSLILLSFVLAAAASATVRSKDMLSPVFKIDRLYRSMLGPSHMKRVELMGKKAAPELLWLTGISAEIKGKDGVTPEHKDFMCHINLDMDAAHHRGRFGYQGHVDERVFTLSQGQFAAVLPRGFGIPVYSDEPLRLFTQVLNHNFPDKTYRVRHKVRVDFVREKERTEPLRPLFVSSAFVMALLEGKDGHFSLEKPDAVTENSSCLPGAHAPGATMAFYDDPYGRKFSGHWVIKPGREVRRTLVTKMMNLPYDTTLHYAAVHLHPFAESLELRDITTGRTVMRSKARNPEKGIGLEHVDYFSSVEGLPLIREHQYELVSVYDNTSGIDQDSMAAVFLYLENKEFKAPYEVLPR